MSDAALLYEWRNDPETRRWSFTTDPVDWGDHIRWLTRVINDRQRGLFVCWDRVPLGQVRLDYAPDNSSAEISITVAPDHRGKGVAAQIIYAAVNRCSPTPVIAHIKLDNEASLRAFRSAGFVETSRADGVVTMRTELKRHDKEVIEPPAGP